MCGAGPTPSDLHHYFGNAYKKGLSVGFLGFNNGIQVLFFSHMFLTTDGLCWVCYKLSSTVSVQEPHRLYWVEWSPFWHLSGFTALQDGCTDKERQAAGCVGEGRAEELQEGAGEGHLEDLVQDGHQPAVLLPRCPDL